MKAPLAACVSSVLAAALVAIAGCSQESAAAIYPSADLRPPGLLAAGPRDSRDFVLRFDEAVKPVQDSFFVEPRAELGCRADGCELVVSFGSDQAPGADYALSGEVDDLRGNRARFLLRFTGWNDRAPLLRISELQTGKNSSKIKPHRDFIELEAMADGNIGGEVIAWTSTVKSAEYRFPGIEIRKGEFIVLHLAPEGLSEELDELGAELSASGGADATANGRDLWCGAMALPDESGALSLSLRPGGQPMDGLFYAAESRSGPLADDRLSDLVTSLSAAGIWSLAGGEAAWGDAFKWKSSPARSICRTGKIRPKLEGRGSGTRALLEGRAQARPTRLPAASLPPRHSKRIREGGRRLLRRRLRRGHRRIFYSEALIKASISCFGKAPTLWAATSPPLKTMRVGMEMILYWRPAPPRRRH